jgi:hypothetical protein
MSHRKPGYHSSIYRRYKSESDFAQNVILLYLIPVIVHKFKSELTNRILLRTKIPKANRILYSSNDDISNFCNVVKGNYRR